MDEHLKVGADISVEEMLGAIALAAPFSSGSPPSRKGASGTPAPTAGGSVSIGKPSSKKMDAAIQSAVMSSQKGRQAADGALEYAVATSNVTGQPVVTDPAFVDYLRSYTKPAVAAVEPSVQQVLVEAASYTNNVLDGFNRAEKALNDAYQRIASLEARLASAQQGSPSQAKLSSSPAARKALTASSFRYRGGSGQSPTSPRHMLRGDEDLFGAEPGFFSKKTLGVPRWGWAAAVAGLGGYYFMKKGK